MKLQRDRNLILATLLLIWGSTIAFGMSWIHRYESTPGPEMLAACEWPADSSIRFTPGRINIVMLAHPRCPCTHANFDEMQRLLNHFDDQAAVHVLFWTPSNASSEWKQTDLWKRAVSMDGVCAHADEAGVEARRFGATTSGHVLVFRGDGTRVYTGGLTTARGQSADGQAAAAICKLIDKDLPARTGLPVFGCPLYDASTQCAGGTKACCKCQ